MKLAKLDKNHMIVSPQTFDKLNGKSLFRFTPEGGKRQFRLPLIPVAGAMEGVGYVMYRGAFVKAVDLRKFL